MLATKVALNIKAIEIESKMTGIINLAVSNTKKIKNRDKK